MPDQEQSLLANLGSYGNTVGPFSQILSGSTAQAAQPKERPSGYMGGGGKLAFLGNSLLQGLRQGRVQSYMMTEAQRNRDYQGHMGRFQAILNNPDSSDEQRAAANQGMLDLVRDHLHPELFGQEDKDKSKKSYQAGERPSAKGKPTRGQASKGAVEAQSPAEHVRGFLQNMFSGLTGTSNLPLPGKVDPASIEARIQKIQAMPDRPKLQANVRALMADAPGQLRAAIDAENKVRAVNKQPPIDDEQQYVMQHDTYKKILQQAPVSGMNPQELATFYGQLGQQFPSKVGMLQQKQMGYTTELQGLQVEDVRTAQREDKEWSQLFENAMHPKAAVGVPAAIAAPAVAAAPAAAPSWKSPTGPPPASPANVVPELPQARNEPVAAARNLQPPPVTQAVPQAQQTPPQRAAATIRGAPGAEAFIGGDFPMPTPRLLNLWKTQTGADPVTTVWAKNRDTQEQIALKQLTTKQGTFYLTADNRYFNQDRASHSGWIFEPKQPVRTPNPALTPVHNAQTGQILYYNRDTKDWERDRSGKLVSGVMTPAEMANTRRSSGFAATAINRYTSSMRSERAALQRLTDRLNKQKQELMGNPPSGIYSGQIINKAQRDKYLAEMDLELQQATEKMNQEEQRLYDSAESQIGTIAYGVYDPNWAPTMMQQLDRAAGRQPAQPGAAQPQLPPVTPQAAIAPGGIDSFRQPQQ